MSINICISTQQRTPHWPGPRVRPLSSVLPVSFGCRWHLAFLILKEAVCFTGGVNASADKHSTVGGRRRAAAAAETHRSLTAVWSSESGGQRTYAALTAAGVVPGQGLPSEDGDPTADRVAVIRLCKTSHAQTEYVSRKFRWRLHPFCDRTLPVGDVPAR